MREHVFTEIDKDKDRMISLKEFLDATSDTREFEKNEGWKVSLRLHFIFLIEKKSDLLIDSYH